MRTRRPLALALLALAAACARPLSEEQKPWIGEWKNVETSLRITAGGRLEWQRRSGGASRSLSAPIQELTDGQITAGVWFLRSRFRVGQPPRQREDGVWTVVVDGQELIKADELGRDPRAAAVPPLPKLRALVAGDLGRLEAGFQTGDFSPFLAEASTTYQSQFTSEKLREGFGPFVERKVALAPLTAGDLVLTEEPAISPQGQLTVKGRYPAVEGRALVVDASYVFSRGEWRSLGVGLQVRRE